MDSRSEDQTNVEEWNCTPEEAVALQKRLAAQLRIQPLPERFEILGAADIAYSRTTDESVAVMLTFRWPDLEPLETVYVIRRTPFPYIPGLLSFREAPPLMEAFDKLSNRPDVILCDGQGIAHPRGIGLASHLGLKLNIPTVGCAKTRLCGKYEELDLKRGNYTPLHFRRKVVGYVYCTRDRVKPIFISPGHMADLESSRILVEQCLGRYRLPEPIRQADGMASRVRREYTQTLTGQKDAPE